jgi:hypothetical protein
MTNSAGKIDGAIPIGEKLLLGIFEKEPKDSYQPNGLPPIDEALHTPEVIACLQKPALELE